MISQLERKGDFSYVSTALKASDSIEATISWLFSCTLESRNVGNNARSEFIGSGDGEQKDPS